MDTLALTIDILVNNSEKLDRLIDKLDDFDEKVGKGTPKNEKFGSSISASTIAAGAAGVAIGLLTSKIGEYIKGSIDAASRTEGLRNGLRTVIPDATEFEATLALIDKQARLPGLQKNDLVRFTTNMRAAGLSGEQTESALTILGSRIVGFGQTSFEAAQVVGQFTQAMNRGKIEGDELNRLFESLPGFKNIVVEMTGVTGGAQDLNDAFAAQGLTVQEGLIPLLEAYDKSLGEINHEAALVKADAYEGALEDLRNTIGQKLLPVYKDFLDRGAETADMLSALVSGSEKLPQPLLDIATQFGNILEKFTPLKEPLNELGQAILPLLKTLWEELVDIFTDFLLPTLEKVLDILVPFYTRLIELATPITNLIKTYLPPLVDLLKTIASVIVDVVLVPIGALSEALGWVIGKITDLINLIPGAKVELNNQAEASEKAAEKSGKQAEKIGEVTSELQKQQTEIVKSVTQTNNFADAADTAAKKQTELKINVAATNIELKNAKTALKEATTPEEIEAASIRITTAIENVKTAKVEEAKTFENESKKQIAILKAEASAQQENENVIKISSKNREKYAEELTKKEEAEAENREIAIQNEVDALSQLITSYTTNSQTEFDARVSAFTTYKNQRIALSDEIIANIESSEMTEAEKTAAIRKVHQDLAKDLGEEWDKITEVEKTELEQQTKQAEEASEAKKKVIQDSHNEILSETKSYLINAKSAYESNNSETQSDLNNSFDRMIAALKTHHAAQLNEAESNGGDTKVLKAKQDAEIATLEEKHYSDAEKRLKKHNKAKEKENKKYVKELKEDQEKAFDALDNISDSGYQGLDQLNQGFLTTQAGAWADWKVMAEDAIKEVIALFQEYQQKKKEIGQLEIKAEREKNEVFKELSEEYFEIEQKAQEKLSELLDKRVELYTNVKAEIEEALQEHEDRVIEIEETYNNRLIEIEEEHKNKLIEINKNYENEVVSINESLSQELLKLGVETNRDILDDTTEFHDEILAIEEVAQSKRESAAKEHTKRLIEIEKEKNSEIISATSEFIDAIIGSFDTMNEEIADKDAELIEIEKEKNEKITEINIEQFQKLTEIAANLRDTLVEINEEESEKLQDIENDLKNKIVEINEEESEKLQDIKNDLKDTLVEINEDLADELEDIENDLKDTITEINEEESEKLQDIKNDLKDTLVEINKNLADELEDIENDLKDTIVEINEDLADELEDIENERKDAAEEFAQDLIDIESDKAKEIEDINEQHQKTLSNIEKQSGRKAEDISLDLEREIEDLNRKFQVDLSGLDSGDIEGRQKLEDKLQQDLAEAQLDAQRDREDLAIAEERKREDAAQKIEEEKEKARDKAQEARENARDKKQKARVEADKKAQEAKDDAIDARQKARVEADKKAQEAKDDAVDARQDARVEADKKAQEAKDDAIDARQDARVEADKKAQEAKDDAVDARQDARVEADKKAQEAKDDVIDARQDARIEADKKAQEAKDDAIDARQDAREDAADARQKAREDGKDKRQEIRDKATTDKIALEDDAQDPTENLNQRISNSFIELVGNLLGDEAKNLFGENFDFQKFFGIDLSEFQSPQELIEKIIPLIPGAIGRLREGEGLTESDLETNTFISLITGLLSGISANEETGGIIGTAAQATQSEGERYIAALEAIDKWEVSANEVIINATNLILGAGTNRNTAITDADTEKTFAEGEALTIRDQGLIDSKTVRDKATQLIAETYNKAQAVITLDEIVIKQSVTEALDNFFEQYANAVLEIDAQTKANIKQAQEDAADEFWGGVLKIGGQVLGAAAGIALSAATGGVIPPTIAAGIGAQLGGAGGELLANKVLDDDEQAGFHNPIHDHLAFLEGSRSGQAVSGRAGSSQRRQFYSQQAGDFSSHFGRGFQGSYSGGSSKMSEVTVVNLEELRFLTRGFQKVLEETVMVTLEATKRINTNILSLIQIISKNVGRILLIMENRLKKTGGGSQQGGVVGAIGAEVGGFMDDAMDRELLPGQPEDMTVFNYRMATRTNRRDNLLLPNNWWKIPESDRRHEDFQQIHGKTYREHAQEVENKRAAEVGREAEVVGIERQLTFHFPQTDMMAYRQGEDIAELARERLMRGINGVNYENARDYLKHSMQGAMNTFDTQSLFPQQQNSMTVDIDALINSIDTLALQSTTSQMPMDLEKSIQRFDTAVDKLAKLEQARMQQPQKVDVTVKQLPPSDNFLITSDDRTRQIVDQRDIN